MVLEFGWIGAMALAELTGDSSRFNLVATSVEFPRGQSTYYLGNRRYHALPPTRRGDRRDLTDRIDWRFQLRLCQLEILVIKRIMMMMMMMTRGNYTPRLCYALLV